MEAQALAAITGRIIGISLSPEMWGAVAVVIYFGRSTKAFFAALPIAAATLIALGFTIIPGYSITAATSAVLALTLWSSIGCGIRAAITKRRARISN
jgi:hypothetical protein